MRGRAGLLAAAALLAPAPALAQQADGLLFALSADNGAEAQVAGGIAEPIFASGVEVVPDGASGPALSLGDNLTLAWSAPGNIYAKRGTLAFYLRSRTPLGSTPLTLFRVGAGDSSSWDMTWLRIDWNGAGYDAFVTDTNLARTRVSAAAEAPAPDRWVHVAFAWDEVQGVRLWIDGRPLASSDRKAHYDAGLFGFGPFQRIVSPYQVHSLYNYRRSGDLDELRIYDRMLGDADIAVLAAGAAPNRASPQPRTLDDPALRRNWLHRHGWEDEAPPALDAPVTAIRKVEFTDTRDVKARMLRGADGIRETTWPGVYNRSRLPGRQDYFILPDWNVYSEGGRSYELSLPDEPWNRIELTGAAYGTLRRVDGEQSETLFRRPEGAERTTAQLERAQTGGTLRFDNAAPETPIQEIAAYHVAPGDVPDGLATLSYGVDPSADPARYASLAEQRRFLEGRFLPEERTAVVALPPGAPRNPRAVPDAPLPVVHVLVPAGFRDPPLGEAPSRYTYGWANMDAGLGGIALDLPALDLQPTHDGLVPLNIRVRDPLWPARDLLDINVSVRPGEPRTLWLDTRDRMLRAEDSLIVSIAAASGGFDPADLAGMRLRLVFEPAAEAKAEHIADRLEQARDNLAFLVEEQPASRLYPIWDRFERDITDVLRVDPGNEVARAYWVEKNPEQPYAPLTLPEPPPGVPAWAHWQTEQLKLFRRFVDWWIDERQVENGEFGGGLSDDTDLVNQWVPLALMGVAPDRYAASVRRVLDATYTNGMWTGGLSRIVTDELHSYEEGINSVAQALQLNWGDPTAVERAMAVGREYGRLVEVNPAGHAHLISAYFSGDQIVREGTHGWQRPYGFLIFHPGLLLVNYNGAPPVRSTVLSLLDGWLAHGEQEDGAWRFPAEIEWATDAELGRGVASASHVFWAGYDWTGEERYLRPITGEIARGNLAALGSVNADLLARLPGGRALAEQIAGGTLAPGGGAVDRNLGGVGDQALARFVRWQETGDTSHLADLYRQEVATTTQRMPVLTEAHLWSDRVSLPSELLQRARLGGVAHLRNDYYPGNLVSWRFDKPRAAEEVGILIPHGDPRRFRVIAHNLSDRSIAAEMIGAELAAGTWTMTGGIDADGNGEADAPAPAREVVLERGAGTALTFPPGATIVYDFALATPHEAPSTRPDIGLSADDLTREGRRLTVRVHSLGAQPTPAGTAIVEDGAGRELARTRFAPLEAPVDLIPRTADVAVTLPRGAGEALRVRLELDGAPREVTASNNQARFGDTIASRLESGR